MASSRCLAAVGAHLPRPSGRPRVGYSSARALASGRCRPPAAPPATSVGRPRVAERRALSEARGVAAAAAGHRQAFAADAATVLIAGAGAIAVGVAGWLVYGRAEVAVRGRLEADELAYVCEGRSSVLCAYVGSKPEWVGQLVTLQKCAEGGGGGRALVRRAEIQRALSASCLKRYVDQPQVVALPIDAVRAIDADIFGSRPHAERKRQLVLEEESPQFRGRVLAMRQRNLMGAPPLGPGATTSPAVAVELRPGCGLSELGGLPSRHAMAAQASAGRVWSSGELSLRDPLALYSGSRATVAAALRERLDRGSGDEVRIFVDGRPVHPKVLPQVGVVSRRRAAGVAGLTAELEGCPVGSLEEVAAATAGVLAQRGGFMVELQRLQCFAAGEAERLAERLLEDLRARGGEAAIDDLRDSAAASRAIAQASRGRGGARGVQEHTKEGRRLMGLATWTPADIVAVKRWLSLFLVGRAALSARVLVTFVRPSVVGPDGGSDAGKALGDMRRRLKAWRFAPLEDIATGLPLGFGVWACVTLAGFDVPEPSAEIPASANELERLATCYRELVTAASAEQKPDT